MQATFREVETKQAFESATANAQSKLDALAAANAAGTATAVMAGIDDRIKNAKSIYEEGLDGGSPFIAGKAGDRLTKGLQAIIKKYSLTFVAYNQGSIVHLETAGTMLLDLKNPLRLLKQLKPRKHMMEEMGAAYMANGLITLAGSRMYTSMADTDEVIDDALGGLENVLKECQ